MENNFALCPAHIQNALVTQHFGAIDIDDSAQEVFQLGRIKGALGFENKAFDVIVMVVVVSVAVLSTVGVITVMCMIAVGMVVMAMFVRWMVTMLAVVMMVAIVCQKVWVNV